MKSIELITFFYSKKEHYPISDKFIEKYQQLDDGDKNSYITYAHKTGHPVAPSNHEPNQKWHLLESWYLKSLIKNKNLNLNLGFTRCPELILWMAEAAGVGSEYIEEAAEYAKEKICEIRNNPSAKGYSKEAVEYMNKMFKANHKKTLWFMMIEAIKSSGEIKDN